MSGFVSRDNIHNQKQPVGARNVLSKALKSLSSFGMMYDDIYDEITIDNFFINSINFSAGHIFSDKDCAGFTPPPGHMLIGFIKLFFLKKFLAYSLSSFVVNISSFVSL